TAARGPAYPAGFAAALQDDELFISDAPYEYLSLFKRDGARVLSLYTDRTSKEVSVPKRFRPAIKGGVVTHNHPGGSPLSGADILETYKREGYEIRAVSV